MNNDVIIPASRNLVIFHVAGSFKLLNGLLNRQGTWFPTLLSDAELAGSKCKTEEEHLHFEIVGWQLCLLLRGNMWYDTNMLKMYRKKVPTLKKGWQTQKFLTCFRIDAFRNFSQKLTVLKDKIKSCIAKFFYHWQLKLRWKKLGSVYTVHFNQEAE